MKNLAGDENCDPVIREELAEANVEIVKHSERLKEEVPALLTGQLFLDGEVMFTFRRAWYYWVVKGQVPLSVAEEMYADPVGRKDVRVTGHCGCPPPADWVRPHLQAITLYHIDSQEGLNLFTKTMREHGLADKLNGGSIMHRLTIAFNSHAEARESLERALKGLKETQADMVRIRGDFEFVKLVPGPSGEGMSVNQKVRDVGAGAQVTGLKIDTL